jgi:hypothetical protein
MEVLLLHCVDLTWNDPFAVFVHSQSCIQNFRTYIPHKSLLLMVLLMESEI